MILKKNDWIIEYRQSEGSGNYSHYTFYYTILPFALSDMEGDDGFKLYPNLSSGQVRAELENSEQEALLNVYDLSGMMLQSIMVRNTQIVSLENLESGLYIYTLRYSNKQSEGKLTLR